MAPQCRGPGLKPLFRPAVFAMMALTLLGVVGSTAIILWAGASILRLLARAQMSEIPALERYGLWFLLGSGYVSVTIALAGFAVYRIGLVTLICAGALA